MKRFSLFSYIATGIILFTPFFSAQAGVVIGGSRVIYPGNQKETSIPITNKGKDTPVFLVQSWVENAQEQKNNVPFILTPPLFRINPNQENLLRIIYSGEKIPQDRESLFWLNVKAIPANDENNANKNTLQLIVKSKIKLIYRPKLLINPQNSTDAYKKITFSGNNNELIITNPTPYYISLHKLTLNGKEIKEANLVPPLGQTRFTIKTNGKNSVSWQAINDYGGITPLQQAAF